jgi:AraC family transcriptional regulator of adaptative response / DNA-3-methyladenine glycosylase II
VERARRLINSGALNGSGVEILANRLGTGTRHMSRLFRKHLAASPIQVAKMDRVQRAKRLLDETDLSMAEIAMRVGFGSLRRFNAVFEEVYRRPPTNIRNVRCRQLPNRAAPRSIGHETPDDPC